MATIPPICLEVKCSEVRRTSNTTYTVDLISKGGQEYAYYDESGNYIVNLYTCFDIQVDMYFSNREGYFWKIASIIQAPGAPAIYTKATVSLYDVNGYNALIDPVEGFYSGAPLNNVTGYVYSLNASGVPLLIDVPNPPSRNWAFSLVNRHILQLTNGGQGTTGYTGSTGLHGETGPSGQTGLHGETGPSGQTGYTGAPGYTGASGYTGFHGETGYTGKDGNQGPRGPPGPQGVAGENGQNGLNGRDGNVGPAGPAGPAGIDGHSTLTGASGTTGYTGYTGSTGYTGYTGASGITGYTGSTGTRGETGYTGIDGSATNTGCTGTNGVGVPAGGLAGQVLTKIDSSDYNTQWTNPNAWIENNIINPPPAITFQTITANSSQIYVPWNYPTQLPIGLISSWVPVINTLSADISMYSGTTNTDILPLMNVSSGYINYHDSNSYITGIVLSRFPGIDGIQSIAFPSLDTRTAFVYHNISLAPMNSPASNINSTIISVWYGNNNPGSNVASITLSTFLEAGPPTAPRTLVISTITASNATFSYIEPQYVDSNDHASLLTIQLYLITYESNASSIRYGDPLADSLHTYSNSTNLSYSVPSLYPDSLYTFSVDAQNSANQTGPFATITATTSNLTPTAPLASLSFPTRYYSGTIYNISSGTMVTNLVNSSAPWTSVPFITPINNKETRGTLVPSNTQLMNLSTTLTIDKVSTIGGAIAFQGFPLITPMASAQSNLTLTPSVYDKYNATFAYYQGFFLESVNTITIGSALFSASPYNYIVNAIQASTFTGSATTGSASFTFQYDGTPGTPSVSITTFNFNASNYAPVSGVNVIHGTPTFYIVTSASNLGTYYYKSPLLTYNNAIVGVWTPASESNLSHVVSGKSAFGFTNPVGFSNSIGISVTNTTYLSTITLSVTANNVSASSSPTAATPIKAIVDGASYLLVYSTLPQTLPTVTNDSTAVKGYHITSATAGAANVPQFVDSSNNSYALTGYNNSESLTGNQELQVSNGKFTAFTGQTIAYQDYTTFFYDASHSNIVNYSGIAHATGDYRYATFAWKIIPVYPATYGFLTFNMVGSSAITITGNLAYVGSEKIRLYYRFENEASPIPTDLNNPLTSAWIDGNLQEGQPANSTTYVTPTNYTQAQTYGLLSANTSGQFSVFIPGLNITSGTNVYLYCRIGIPMDSAFSFSYITATMS